MIAGPGAAWQPAGEPLHYEVVDVFADRPYGGNPVSVVLDAGHLSGAQMQTVAREFRLGETVFLMEPKRADADFRVRIFTQHLEIPFAGHPSLGAASVIARDRGVRAGRLVMECQAGPRELHVADGGAVTLSAGPPDITGPVSAGPALEAAGLTEGDWTGEPVRICSTGLGFAFLLVRADAVDRALPDDPRVRALSHYGISSGLVVVAWDAAIRTADVRVFAAGVGVSEDPVTGSAALALGAVLVSAGLLPGDGITSFEVLQGRHAGRPSRISAGVHTANGQVLRTWVTGTVAWTARGLLAMPDPQ